MAGNNYLMPLGTSYAWCPLWAIIADFLQKYRKTSLPYWRIVQHWLIEWFAQLLWNRDELSVCVETLHGRDSVPWQTICLPAETERAKRTRWFGVWWAMCSCSCAATSSPRSRSVFLLVSCVSLNGFWSAVQKLGKNFEILVEFCNSNTCCVGAGVSCCPPHFWRLTTKLTVLTCFFCPKIHLQTYSNQIWTRELLHKIWIFGNWEIY